jgi:hypothetical protein
MQRKLCYILTRAMECARRRGPLSRACHRQQLYITAPLRGRHARTDERLSAASMPAARMEGTAMECVGATRASAGHCTADSHRSLQHPCSLLRACSTQSTLALQRD